MSAKVLKCVAVALIELLMLVGAQSARARHHHHRGAETTAGQFDYYVLSLSWSPAFCIQQPDSAECNGPRRFGFIVHGLWPQNERGWPQHCGNSELPDS